MINAPVWLAAALLMLAAPAAGAAETPTAVGARTVAPYEGRVQSLERASDWTALEGVAREALAALGPPVSAPGTDLATADLWLADALKGQSRLAEAEALYRQALELRRRLVGPETADTAAAMESLALGLMAEGKYNEAEALMRQALAIDERTPGSQSAGLARAENDLGRILRVAGRYAEAEPHFRRGLEIREKVLGADDPDTATSLNNLGLMLWSEGRLAEAEQLLRRALAIREKTLGPDDAATALAVGGLALVVHDEGRLKEAEPLYRRALAATEKAQGPDRPDTAMILTNLGGLLWDEGRTDEVEPLLRRALEIRLKALGPDHPDTAMGLNNLAFALEAKGRHAEAEALYRQALAIDQKVLGPDHTDTAIVMRSIGELLQDQARWAEAEPLFRGAVVIDEKAVGPDHPDTADAHQSLALTEERQAKYAQAVDDYRRACAPKMSLADGRDLIGEGAVSAKVRASRCSVRLALSLWGLAASGGGGAQGAEALRREAFLTVQRAALSAAGEAMGRSAALTTAGSAGVGGQASDYEAALVERGRLEQAFAAAASAPGEGGVERRADLVRDRNAVLAKIDALKAELESKAPRYWDYRSPRPIDVAALQARHGPDSVLLSRRESLVVFLIPPGKDKGLVFAVSKAGFAWAQIPLTGTELEAKVRAVRGPIEQRAKAFNRQAAYDLYHALLGDAAIQSVIAATPTLLFVTAGPLTSLPPGVLVTAPPLGGWALDGDQEVLRRTPWLLRDKAVDLLPTVSSLRTLRQLNRGRRVAATDPLLAFADPDFGGGRLPAPGEPVQATARGFADYFEDGHPMRSALRSLPPLPGARVEGQALVSALGGAPDSLLTGQAASKAELLERNADGRLSRVRVIEFATHGLVAGSATWLAEPALALAVGDRPEDELLLASEASTLRLNADWVLLSACNTASRDGPEAEGLSGLSRAFFFAGAHSLLVSHWPVRDDIAPRLVPAILLAERDAPGIGRAEALRRASLAILDDPTLRAANPANWAPFSLIGEAGR